MPIRSQSGGSAQETLDPIPNAWSSIDNKANKAVRSALKLIKDNYSAKSQRDTVNKTIKDLIDKGFSVGEIQGPRRINLKKLYQAWWKTMQRVRILDFAVHGSGRPEWMEKMVTDGISTVLRKGGYISMFRDKGGLFQNGFGYGYAFGWFGTRNSNKGFPFKFQALANDNVYVDARATSMRSGSKPVKEAMVITSMTWAEFVSKWPEFEKKASIGRIPRDFSTEELDQSKVQTGTEYDIIEVGYYYNVVHKHFVQFAGPSCTIIEELSDKDYPYTFKDLDTGEEEAYIPIIHFMGMPSFEGFYDHGIFNSIYDLAVIYNRILNMQANYTLEGVDPVRFFSVPQGQAANVFEQVDSAMKMRAAGKSPIAVIEYDPSNPNSTAISAQALQVQSLINEAQILFDRLDLEVKRFGINLDEPEAGNITATQILADEESANRFVKQVMEGNATEFEFILKVVIDQIPDLIRPAKVDIEKNENGEPILDETGQPKKILKSGDKTPLQMTTKVQIPEGDTTYQIKADIFTLGDLASELDTYEYFVKVNERSGADLSKLRAAQIARVLQVTPPGSKAYFDLLAQFANINDIDQDSLAFGGQQGAPGGGGSVQGEFPEAGEAGATEPLGFSPRRRQQEVAI